MVIDNFKKVYVVLLFTLISSNGYSQMCTGVSAYIFNSGFNVGAFVGPNVFVGDGFGSYKLNGSLGLSQNIFIGYEFSDVLSSRALFGNSSLNWPNPDPIPSLMGKRAFSTQMISVEALYNLSNYLNYYNLYRPYDFSILAGVGLIMREKSNFDSEYTGFLIKGGMQFDYRLSFQLNLNLNATLNVMPEKVDGVVSGEPFNMIPELKVGITYHIRR